MAPEPSRHHIPPLPPGSSPRCFALGWDGPAFEASVTGGSFSFSDAFDPREAQRAGHRAKNLSYHTEGAGTPDSPKMEKVSVHSVAEIGTRK